MVTTAYYSSRSEKQTAANSITTPQPVSSWATPAAPRRWPNSTNGSSSSKPGRPIGNWLDNPLVNGLDEAACRLSARSARHRTTATTTDYQSRTGRACNQHPGTSIGQASAGALWRAKSGTSAIQSATAGELGGDRISPAQRQPATDAEPPRVALL